MSISSDLSNIERHARWVQSHAEHLNSTLPFETRAEEELERAEVALRDALVKVTRARRIMVFKRAEQYNAA